MSAPWPRSSSPDEGARSPASGPAIVRKARANGTAQVARPGGELLDAGIAVVGYTPAAGDQVLVFVDDGGRAWIIGVMSPSPLLDQALVDQALVEQAHGESPTGETRVHDRRGRLLFEYDPETNRAVLHAAAGDLELRVPDGAFRVSARDGVAVDTDAAVKLRAGRELELTTSAGEDARSSVRLQPGELSLSGAVVTLAAARAELLADRIGVKARQLESHLERVRHVAKVIDVRAGRIVERAVDSYREIERVSQTRAGRLKLVAKRAAQLVGENTLVKARDRVKVKGERIHLA